MGFLAPKNAFLCNICLFLLFRVDVLLGLFSPQKPELAFVACRLRQKSACRAQHTEKCKPCSSRCHLDLATRGPSIQNDTAANLTDITPVRTSFFVLCPSDALCTRINGEKFCRCALFIANAVERKQRRKSTRHSCEHGTQGQSLLLRANLVQI